MSDERLYSIKLGLDATAGARNMRQFHSLFNKTLKDMGESAPDIKAFKELAKQAETSESALQDVGDEMADLVRSYNDLKAEARARDKLKFIPDKEIERQVAAVRSHFATLKKSGKLSAKELSRAYEETERQIKSLRGETETSAIKTEGALKRIAKQALAVTAAFFGFRELKNAAVNLLQTGDQFERLSVQLESLTGSSEQAQVALDWIKDFTQNTPLQLEQVTEQFTKLKAFGLDPMDGTLQGLVDANERLGGGMDRLNGIVLAFGQAWAKQKLQGEEIMQLVERGVPVWDLLAKVTGKNTAELQKLSSAGKLGRDTIQALMDELAQQSAGAAAKNMTLLSGYVSNLKDQWQLFLAEIADAGALDYAKDQLKTLLQTIKELQENGTLNRWAQQISDVMVRVSGATQNAIGFVVKFKDELTLLASGVIVSKLLAALASGASSLGNFGASLKLTAASAAAAGTRLGALRVLMLSLPGTLAITLAIAGLKAAHDGIDSLMAKLSGYEESQRRLAQIEDQFQNSMLDRAAAYRHQAEALGTVRDLEYKSTEQLLAMSAEQRQAYEDKLTRIKDYLALKVKEAQATQAAGLELSEETKRAVELYKTHADGMQSLIAANEYAAKAIRNGVSIETQQAIDRMAELRTQGMSAADALAAVGDSLDLTQLDDLRTFNALLIELKESGVEMSTELEQALSDITGDIGYDDIERLRTTINAAFTDAEDRARVLGQVLKSGLSDELGRLGLSFEELETGIDASAQQAVDDFKALVAAIKETGVEADIAEQKILEAYRAAAQKAGDSTEAVEQLNNALEKTGEDGTVSQDKVQDAMDETAGTAEEAATQITNSNAQVEESYQRMEEQVLGTGDATEDALKKASHNAMGLAQLVGDYMNATVESLNQLSAQTAAMFQARLGIETLPIVTEIEAMENALAQTEQAAINAQTSMGSFAGDVTGLNNFVREVETASNQVSASFYRQQLAYESMMAEINSGDLSGYELVNAAELAIGRMDQLNESDLSALEGAISSARREMEALNDAASGTLIGLQNELDRLRGNQEAIEQRQYEQKKAELEALISEANAAQNYEAVADYEEALRVLEEIRREKERQRQEDAKAQTAQPRTTNEPASRNAPQANQRTESREQTVNLRLPGGGSARLSGSTDDVDALLNYLAEAQASTTE